MCIDIALVSIGKSRIQQIQVQIATAKENNKESKEESKEPRKVVENTDS